MEIPSEIPELDYVSIANLVKKEKLLDWLDQMIVVVQKSFRYTKNCSPEALPDVDFGIFQAYVNNKEGNAKKVIKGVFKKNDVGFRSGDILIMDKYGYLYFRDRTGDTFRWRGENVSTSEVETVVANLCDHKEAVCYGVEIPGAEGKAGMVAILGKTLVIHMRHF